MNNTPSLQVMLAGKAPEDLASIKFPVLVSPKIDGIRATVINGVVMSRNMKPIPNAFVQEKFGKKELDYLDGELTVGSIGAPDLYNRTQSAVMSDADEAGQSAVFNVFDDISYALNFPPGSPFTKRLDRAHKRISKLRFAHVSDNIHHVPHCWVYTDVELLNMEERFLQYGYEGLMIRDPEGPYKHGRSTTREGWLMKLKRFEDAEARVLGFQELQHNDNPTLDDPLGRTKRSTKKEGKRGGGTLGALEVEDLKTRVRFTIGTGLTEDMRREIWARQDALKDAIVTYKYLPAGVKDRPRHPVFKGFRDLSDF